MKPSFILHKDSLCVLEDLTNEQRGELFYAIYCYQIGKEIELKPIIKIAFSQFKNQFIRDEEKFIKTIEARKQAGAKGGKQTQAKGSKSSKPKQKVANRAVSVNVNESVNVNDNKKDIKEPLVYIHENEDSNQLFLEYLALRKKMKLSNSETVIKRLLKKAREFEKNGHYLNDVISNAITGSWKDFYEPKTQTQQPKSFKQQDAQRTDTAIDAFLNARDNGFDLRNVNDDVQDVEVIGR